MLLLLVVVVADDLVARNLKIGWNECTERFLTGNICYYRPASITSSILRDAPQNIRKYKAPYPYCNSNTSSSNSPGFERNLGHKLLNDGLLFNEHALQDVSY